MDVSTILALAGLIIKERERFRGQTIYAQVNDCLEKINPTDLESNLLIDYLSRRDVLDIIENVKNGTNVDYQTFLNYFADECVKKQIIRIVG